MEQQPKNWDHLYSEERVYDNPIVLKADIVHGFKRGSKDLGIPTANLNMGCLGATGNNLETGIYFGWALLREKPFACVVSVGWNPFYNNTEKTIEAHLLERIDDFYGETMCVLLCGYLRQEINFTGIDDLIGCIHSDIARSKTQLMSVSSKRFENLENWASITNCCNAKSNL